MQGTEETRHVQEYLEGHSPLISTGLPMTDTWVGAMIGQSWDHCQRIGFTALWRL